MKVFTCDESWCYGYDPETKQQSSQWKPSTLPHPQKRGSSEIRCLDYADLFLHCKRDFVSSGQTVNKTLYVVFVGCSEVEMPQPLVRWRVVVSSQQCTCTHSLECETVFDLKWHDPAYPPSLSTQSCSV